MNSENNTNNEFRRKRDYWTQEGKNLLHKLVQPKIHIIDDKGNSSAMVRKKLDVWGDIRKRMAILGYRYEVKQLKAQYFRYKIAQKEIRQNIKVNAASPTPSEEGYRTYSNDPIVKPEYESDADAQLNGSNDSQFHYSSDKIIQVAEIIEDNADDNEMDISSTPSRKRKLPPIRRSSIVSMSLNSLMLRKRIKLIDREISMAGELHELRVQTEKRNLEIRNIQLEIEAQNLELIKLRVEDEKKKSTMCSCVRQFVTNCH